MFATGHSGLHYISSYLKSETGKSLELRSSELAWATEWDPVLKNFCKQIFVSMYMHLFRLWLILIYFVMIYNANR